MGRSKSTCTRDVDLAAEWGLTRPRDIRRTIRAAEAAGDLEIIESGSAREPRATKPLVWSVIETARKGDRGATQDVAVYYLTEAAKRIVVLRLETALAWP